MNIGIAFGFLTADANIWNNESFQRIIFLYLMLNKIEEYNVYLINFGIDINNFSSDNKHYISNIDVINWNDIKNNKLDVFIESSIKLQNNITTYLREQGTRLIRFETENNFIIDIEDIILNHNKGILYEDKYDEIWILDNNKNTNKYYLTELYKVPVKVLPFIWSPYFIEKEKELLKNYNLIFDYLPHEKKDITIFETVDAIDKLSFYPLFILEKAYNLNKQLFKDKIGKIRMMNTIKYKNNSKFLSIVNKLNIKKDGICTFEGKFDRPVIFSQFTDIVLTTQLENNLNNLFFETLYGHYPLLHNTDNFKRNGYFYTNLNFDIAVEKLIHIIKNHDKSLIDYYIIVNGILDNYSIDNSNIINIYKNILEKKTS
jgi:hypothetical protein